jgi:large repetitive protein
LLLTAVMAVAVAASALAQEQYQDGFPPDTGIRKGPKAKTDKRKAKFEFGGSEPGVRFECRVDADLVVGPWLPCTSPYTLRGLARRTKYVFYVRAVDVSGNPDPRPADRRWKVTKKKD